MERKEQSFPGVNYTIFDTNMLQTVPIAWTVVTHPIWKSSVHVSYIGIKENINAGEVIEFSGVKYRVVIRKRVRGKGNVYRIKRLDDVTISSVDVNNSKAGTKVRLCSRRSYEQQLSLIFDEVEACRV